MKVRICASLVVVALVPSLATAQAPVAKAFRDYASQSGKNLIAAAEVMPADKYAFKPTPAQMSFADIVVHLAEGNDYLCGVIGGAKPSARTAVAATASKDALIARLKETFHFCDEALEHLDDSKLTEETAMFGKNRSRAEIEALTIGDWADHYSQMAIYLRLNGQLPPTAKKPAM
jgi:uncharacterized damage-inducible protein DinB